MTPAAEFETAVAVETAEKEFDAAVAVHSDSKKDVTAKAVRLLALAARAVWPDSVTLHFEDSDQGDWLDLDKVLLKDGTEVDDPTWDVFSEAYWGQPSWLHPEDVPGFTWERDRRGNTTDAHINIEEALA